MDSSLLSDLQSEFPDQIQDIKTIEPKDGEFIPADEILPEDLATELEHDSLYRHQAEAISKLQSGSNICLTTGTDSGKTLVYALYSAICSKENETTLCIYPTKALSRDQKDSLKDIYSSLGLSLQVGVYDGDADRDQKRKLRESADVILTNFQGLNYYLPHHSSWSNFFSKLGSIVIDEAHMYTGIMGTHASWITRRLIRLVKEKYHAQPRIIVTTATLGNPQEHSETLTGQPMEVIQTDYSPQETQEIVFWNPTRDDSQRNSPHRTVSTISPWIVDRTDSQILIFTPSRRTTELCMKWIQEESQDYTSTITVESYHAGHSKAERRETESKIKSGEIDIIVSTTALEVGIDIGGLDIVITDTYPNSRMSFWQQIGRAGRENSQSTTFFVADKSSTDQYIIDNPSYLLEDDVEDAIIDLTNKHISMKHIAVAASEKPLEVKDTQYFTSALNQLTTNLSRKGILSGELSSGKVTYNGPHRPETRISLYSTSASGFSVQIYDDSEQKIKTLPEVSRTRAYRELFPGATYLHKGVKYIVDDFIETDTKKEVHLKEADDLDYYTQSKQTKTVTNINSKKQISLGYGITVHKGQIIVQEQIPSYSKMYNTGENVHDIPTGLDGTIDLGTEACWITFDSNIGGEIAERTHDLVGSLHGAEHSLIELSPMILNVDSQDIGGLSTRFHQQTGKATIFIYDGIDGGIGYAYKIFEELTAVSQVANTRITNCDCTETEGCLECIMSTSCGSHNEPLHKKGSAIITYLISSLPDME